MSKIRKKLLFFLQIPQKHTYATTGNESLSAQENEVGTDEDPFPSQTKNKNNNQSSAQSKNLFEGSKLSSGYANTLLRKETNTQGWARGNGPEETKIEPIYSAILSSAQRVCALVKRYLLIKARDIHRIANLSYFPITDILIGGLMWMWQERNLSLSELESTTALYTCELTFWIIINAIQFETCFNFIEELQSRNIVNLFVSSLHYAEWLVASFILGLIESFIAALICGIILYSCFSVSLFVFGWYLPCFFVLLAISGWIMSVYTISILVYHGQRMTVLLWALPYFILPISAAFYPLEALPNLVQWIGSALPTTYIFEALRAYMATQHIPIFYFLKSSLLALLYLVGAIVFFTSMFKKSKEKGLARLEND